MCKGHNHVLYSLNQTVVYLPHAWLWHIDAFILSGGNASA
jgi:hypothetical protein